MNRIIVILCLLLGTITMQAQNAFVGQHRYDGEHKNEISGYAIAGNNVVVSGYGGFGLSYKRHLTDRWHVGADVQQQWGKQLYSNDVQGGYRLPVWWGDI